MATDLNSGLMPVLDVNVPLVLTLRTILGSGTVTLESEVALSAGDVVGLFYEADGLAISINIRDVVWSVHQIA